MLSIFNADYDRYDTTNLAKLFFKVFPGVCALQILGGAYIVYYLSSLLNAVASGFGLLGSSSSSHDATNTTLNVLLWLVFSIYLSVLELLGTRIWLDSKVATVRNSQYTQFLLEDQLGLKDKTNVHEMDQELEKSVNKDTNSSEKGSVKENS
ncbi:MAG: hypothetical protein QM613_03200 [Micrococcaceae bacterium]